MGVSSETVASIEQALLEGASIRRVIDLKVAESDQGLIVGAKVDIDAELSMREVSVILHQAKRRIRAAANATLIFVEPDVWVDPDAVQPTTSAVVMLGLD